MFALAYLAAVRKDAIGGCGPDEPRRRTVAAHRARGQTPAVGAGQPEVTAAAHRPALVSMATETSATRPARPLAPTNTTHAAYSPAVVRGAKPRAGAAFFAWHEASRYDPTTL